MPRNRKCYVHGSVLELCFRAEEGLVLPSTQLICTYLLGLLARAQSLYPVTICHYIVMANHMHLLVVVNNPADIPRFIEYVKRESAHVINRLLGRDQHTVWSAGYDSPVVLDAAMIKRRILYIYTNPQSAGLVERIEDYPHLSSWDAFMKGGAEYEVPYFPRTAIPPQKPGLKVSVDILLSNMLESSAGRATLVITPDAWTQSFEATAKSDPELLRAEVVSLVRETEEQLSREKTSVLGVAALRNENIRLDYAPKKRAKRMICLGSTKKLRKAFISWFKASAAEAAEAVQLWLSGIKVNIPPGFFAPGGGVHASLNPLFSPLPLA